MQSGKGEPEQRGTPVAGCAEGAVGSRNAGNSNGIIPHTGQRHPQIRHGRDVRGGEVQSTEIQERGRQHQSRSHLGGKRRVDLQFAGFQMFPVDTPTVALPLHRGADGLQGRDERGYRALQQPRGAREPPTAGGEREQRHKETVRRAAVLHIDSHSRRRKLLLRGRNRAQCAARDAHIVAIRTAFRRNFAPQHVSPHHLPNPKALVIRKLYVTKHSFFLEAKVIFFAYFCRRFHFNQ